MFKILVVDDSIQKINSIITVFQSLIDNGNVLLDYEMEVKKACKILEKETIDLLILDVQLPSLGVDFSTMKTGGIDLLKIIHTQDRVKKPAFIIGLTEFDESFLETSKYFEDNLCVLLKYDNSTEDWKKKILTKASYLIKVKQNQSKKNLDYFFDCAIITAVDVEFDSVYNCGLKWVKIECEWDSTIYYESIHEKNGNEKKFVLVKQHQMGMVSAATLTSKLIYKYKPRMVCMLGIAGGRESEVKLGDLIVVSETWDYGSGKLKSDDVKNRVILEPEPHQISIQTAFKEYLQNNFTDVMYEIRKKWNNGGGDNKTQDIKVHVGALASGAAVIQNTEIVTDFILPQHRKILGVDMETYAVYYASCNATKPTPKFLAMKSVCDFADKTKNDGFQKYSAFVSSEFFIRTIYDLLDKISD